MDQKEQLIKKLLHWYDENKRTLPWRALSGEVPNPYYVYLSEIFLQQTTVVTVIDYFNRFINKWPTLKDLSDASLENILREFQGLGYYSRAKNLKKAVDLFYKHGGISSDTKTLLAYPGIGDYTAKAIAAIAFDKPVIPVDGNVIRVFSRYFGLLTPLPHLKKKVLEKSLEININKRSGDFAQSLMDLGSMICKPKNPTCSDCPLQKECIAYRDHLMLDLPFREKKQKPPQKIGIVYIYETDDFLLIQKNPPTGLLSNLWGLPTSEWREGDPSVYKGYKIVRHTFTHFTLTLKIESLPLDIHQSLEPLQKIIQKKELSHYPLSTLMRKVLQIR
jgi:A/G-specific adenine glycosylase